MTTTQVQAECVGTKRDAPSPPSAVSAPGVPAKRARKIKKYKTAAVDPISAEGVLRTEIDSLLAVKGIHNAGARYDMTAFFNRDRTVPWPGHRAVEVEVLALSSTGLGIALHDNKPVIVPYSIPGDRLSVQIHRTEEFYLEAKILQVLQSSEDRDDSLVKCKYFGVCSGCQYQFVPYQKQLEIKRNVIVSAFKHNAPNLVASRRLPDVQAVIGSPLHYGYRTKLTPHFDVPRKGLQTRPAIGFGQRGSNKVVDIESCDIGTAVVNQGMAVERKTVLSDYKKYKKGATILLREGVNEDGTVFCCTNPKDIISEKVADFKFKFKAGEFFQNNNSILPLVIDFVQKQVQIGGQPPKYLVDTYCGCGLFAISCSSAVETVVGVEISAESVKFAEENAKINDIKNAKFVVGEAEKIFEHVQSDPDHTSIVIDPPRKGCDKAFLDQLVVFNPAKVVYVSCNVHSQARDLEYLLDKTQYKLEVVGGFDFFPQTYHVEGVAVLSRV